MHKFLALLIFILIPSLVFSQEEYHTKSKKAIKLFQDATEAFNGRMDSEALELLGKALDKDDKFIEAYMLKAEILYQQQKFKNEIEIYEKVLEIDPNYSSKLYTLAANGWLKLGEYAKAKAQLEKCLSKEKLSKSQKRTAEILLERANFGINAMAHPVPFNPVNLGDKVNSPLNEYWPSLTADEQTLIITVLVPRPGVNPDAIVTERTFHEDLFVSQLKDGEWGRAHNIGPEINTFEYNEGTQAFSVDGLHLFYTVCNKPGDYGRCDIYYSHKVDERWTMPENIGPPISTSAWESHPSFSSDGRTLYFVSNRRGGHGEMDIWKSVYQGKGKWSVPVNLGDNVNTRGNEMSPFIHPDNKTLYFASNGHLGMGGMDIFVSRIDSMGIWQKPVNLGYPINTYKDEKGLIVNAKGDLAYFSSNRDEKKRNDIYNFELYEKVRPTRVTYVKGRVYDAVTKKGLEAEFELTDLETDSLVVKSNSEQETGNYLVSLPTERNYAFNIFKEGYMFHSESFSLKNLKNPKSYNMDFALKPIKENETVILKNIFFETDSFTLKPESKSELEVLIQFLNENPALSIEIGGHTDNTGSKEYNKELSEKRAESVYNYLLDNGISKEKLSYKGYDFSEPIAPNDTPEGRALNRRTEFKVTKITE
ncbi:MAG: hypothetical protein C0594_07200 [Marinilabiliales bacterium]|nr:MAG: hypothetical protein C0594_07200 [Marinilabiliales bacterium]